MMSATFKNIFGTSTWYCEGAFSFCMSLPKSNFIIGSAILAIFAQLILFFLFKSKPTDIVNKSRIIVAVLIFAILPLGYYTVVTNTSVPTKCKLYTNGVDQKSRDRCFTDYVREVAPPYDEGLNICQNKVSTDSWKETCMWNLEYYAQKRN